MNKNKASKKAASKKKTASTAVSKKSAATAAPNQPNKPQTLSQETRDKATQFFSRLPSIGRVEQIL